MDRPDHVQPADHRVAVRVRLLPRPGDRDHRARDARLDPLPAVPAVPPRVRARGSPASATSPSRSSPTPRRRSAEAAAGRRSAGAAAPAPLPASAPMPIEIRRFGVGHRRPDGPPGTVGVTGQVIHCDGRGLVAELAFARNARIEPHANPNTTWFIVIEGGGWVGVGDERTRVAAGEAAVWPADIPHAAWTEHSEMRAIMVEFAGADDAAITVPGGPRRRRTRRPAGRPGQSASSGAAAAGPAGRTGRPGRGRARLTRDGRAAGPTARAARARSTVLLAAALGQPSRRSRKSWTWSVRGQVALRCDARRRGCRAGPGRRDHSAAAQDLGGRGHDRRRAGRSGRSSRTRPARSPARIGRSSCDSRRASGSVQRSRTSPSVAAPDARRAA